jgi:hypothetical protein
MLAGNDEARMIFDNEFATGEDRDVRKKPSNARFSYGLVFNSNRYGVWIDYKRAYFYVTDSIPKDGKPVFALTKKDNTIDYQAIKRTNEYLKILCDIYYKGGLRYSSIGVKQTFLQLLEFLGVV